MSAPTPGHRRRAATPRRVRGTASGVAALLLLGVAATAVWLTPSTDVSAPPRTSTGAVVDSTLLGCPETDNGGRRLRTDFDVGLVDADGLDDDGSLTVGPYGAPGSATTIRRGRLVELDVDSAPVLDASGGVAAGLFGSRTDRAGPGVSAVGSCVAPRASWWFAGAGATLDHTSDLTLANLDPGPAVVDVTVFGPDGRVETVGTRGITIAPGDTATLPMADIAPQTEEALVHVQATRGRVAASVADQYARRPEATGGFEWLPGTDRASRTLRLAGVPEKARHRTLLVGNPSELEALVEVQVAGSGGTFAPADLEGTSVAPGTVETIDLDDLPDEPVAIRVRSRVPVVATVRSTLDGDASYAGPVAPLVGPAAVPTVAGGRATVQLTAGDVPARVRVEGFTRKGESTSVDELDIDPTATATWRPRKRSAYAVVTPLDGAVYGAATYARPGLAQTPLVTLPIRIQLPEVVPGPQ